MEFKGTPGKWVLDGSKTPELLDMVRVLNSELSYCLRKLQDYGEEVDFQTPSEAALLLKTINRVMTNTETANFLMVEVKALEAKKDKIKKTAVKYNRYVYPAETAKINKIIAQQMILRKMARKINKLDKTKS